MNLNWKELALAVESLGPRVSGLFVERVFVPARQRFPGGYLKAEWALRLTGRGREAALVFSVRPRHPYLFLSAGKALRNSTGATHSPFSLSLAKQLKGARIAGIETLPKERIVRMGFEGGHELVLCLIPATPEALLLHDGAIVSRSRNLEVTEGERWSAPAGGNPPADPPLRTEIVESVESLAAAIERDLDREAFDLRLASAGKAVRELLKHAADRLHQSETALREAEREPDWQRYGDLLKSAMHLSPPLVARGREQAREVQDFESGELVAIPGDPKLSLQQQVERFYQHARRRARKIEEARSRIAQFGEKADEMRGLVASLPSLGDWAALEKLERAANVSLEPAAAGKKERATGWLGKTFRSRDGMTILVGRSRDENLELTFKHARGNDLWLHVRGRPGAHALIPMQSGKSAPLDTLLDAAALVIYYSGGEKWGTTEVDYTHKKHVKRIKDSTEASYTHNKTLLVQPDPQRLKRLLGG